MMRQAEVHVEFPNRLVMVGFGSVGQGVLPLIFRHIDIAPERVVIIAADDGGVEEARRYGVRFIEAALLPETLGRTLDPLLGAGDFLLNLSVDVSSLALIRHCRERGALYLDTCIEPWAGGYTDTSVSAGRRTNYAMREEVLALRTGAEGAPTAAITHGANPGLVSHFLKQALLNLAEDTGAAVPEPRNREEWARLACRLGVKVIHIAERDTQYSGLHKQPDEFVNTWSVDGFVSEACQPAELGWGTHELTFPTDGRRHESGSGAAIYLSQPSAMTRVRSWTPLNGPYHGLLIAHGESVSMADYLTLWEGSSVVYRPTVHYAYHPADAALLSVHELCGRNFQTQARKRILREEVTGGIDELGVLLAGHGRNAYWYGSQLSIAQARSLAPYNNATTLQVTAGVLAGVVWVMENVDRGIVEPDEIDFRRPLQVAVPYLGAVVGQYTSWTPLANRERLLPERLDRTDPWQFANIRVG
jgi:homospermidine synthase